MTDHNTSTVQPFITRWEASGAAELANYQLFLSALCDVLDVPRPNPATPDGAENAYVFEKAVPLCQARVLDDGRFVDGVVRVGLLQRLPGSVSLTAFPHGVVTRLAHGFRMLLV